MPWLNILERREQPYWYVVTSKTKIDEAVKKLKELGIEASGFYGDVSRREDNKYLLKQIFVHLILIY